MQLVSNGKKVFLGQNPLVKAIGQASVIFESSLTKESDSDKEKRRTKTFNNLRNIEAKYESLLGTNDLFKVTSKEILKKSKFIDFFCTYPHIIFDYDGNPTYFSKSEKPRITKELTK